MPHIKVAADTELYVKDWGQGRPVVLIHGWPLSADSWDDQAVAIAEAGFRVIAYDRRGFGRSSQPWSGYDYDTLADDLAAVLDQTGARDAALVGFSMGGGEVARYLSRHGGQGVKQAVLISSIVPYMLKTGDNPNGVPQATFDEMAGAMQQDRAAFFSGFFSDFYGTSLVSKPVSEEVLRWSAAVAMQASLKATLECAKSFATTDFRGELGAFRCPTLIIHGTQDKTVPIDATARPAAKAIPASGLVEYQGSAHGVLATDKARVAGDIVGFLKG